MGGRLRGRAPAACPPPASSRRCSPRRWSGRTGCAAPWRGYCTPLDYPCLGVSGRQQEPRAYPLGSTATAAALRTLPHQPPLRYHLEVPTTVHCHVCDQPVQGDRWQAAIRHSLDSAGSNLRRWRWVSVCRACRWQKPPRRRPGVPNEIAGEWHP